MRTELPYPFSLKLGDSLVSFYPPELAPPLAVPLQERRGGRERESENGGEEREDETCESTRRGSNFDVAAVGPWDSAGFRLGGAQELTITIVVGSVGSICRPSDERGLLFKHVVQA